MQKKGKNWCKVPFHRLLFPTLLYSTLLFSNTLCQHSCTTLFSSKSTLCQDFSTTLLQHVSQKHHHRITTTKSTSTTTFPKNSINNSKNAMPEVHFPLTVWTQQHQKHFDWIDEWAKYFWFTSNRCERLQMVAIATPKQSSTPGPPTINGNPSLCQVPAEELRYAAKEFKKSRTRSSPHSLCHSGWWKVPCDHFLLTRVSSASTSWLMQTARHPHWQIAVTTFCNCCVHGMNYQQLVEATAEMFCRCLTLWYLKDTAVWTTYTDVLSIPIPTADS